MAAQDAVKKIVIKKAGIFSIGKGILSSSCSNFPLEDEMPVTLSCGKFHCAIICESGRVFTAATNTYHEWSAAEPSLVTSLQSVKVVQAACGDMFTLFLTDKGEVYSAGVNNNGQLGLGDTTDRATPVLVRGLPMVKKVAAGGSHSVVLTCSGEVWVCGDTKQGLLDVATTEEFFKRFTFVPHITVEIVNVSCSDKSLIALTSSSQGFVMYNEQRAGTHLFSKTDLVDVACGSSSSVLMARDGTIWTWDHLCTPGSKQELKKISGLENHKVSKVCAGNNGLAVVTDKGDVLLWANNGDIGLGSNNATSPFLVQKLNGLLVQDVAFGPDCTMILIKSEVEEKMEIVVAQEGNTDYLTRPEVTGLEKCIMKSLECPVCFKVMVAPIHMCENGHSICGACYTRILNGYPSGCPTCRRAFSSSKNFALQGLAEESHLPCVGCLLRMPALELEDHANMCARRILKCPLDADTCTWSGRREDLQVHAATKHTGRLWMTLPRTFNQSFPDEDQTHLLTVKKELFLFHRAFNNTKNAILFVVIYLGLPNGANRFRCKLEINIDNTEWYQLSLTKVCSYVDSLEKNLQSESCIMIDKDKIQNYLQNGQLRCKVGIFDVETSN